MYMGGKSDADDKLIVKNGTITIKDPFNENKNIYGNQDLEQFLLTAEINNTDEYVHDKKVPIKTKAIYINSTINKTYFVHHVYFQI